MKLILFLILRLALADGFSRNEADHLIKAKSAAALNHVTKLYSQLRVAAQLCKIQNENKSLPLACYDQLRIEGELGISNQQTLNNRKMVLDQICVDASKSVFELNDQSIFQIKNFGKTCQKAIIKSFCQRKYMEKSFDVHCISFNEN